MNHPTRILTNRITEHLNHNGHPGARYASRRAAAARVRQKYDLAVIIATWGFLYEAQIGRIKHVRVPD